MAGFVPNLSTLLAPLYSLLQQEVKWRWSEQEAEAFDSAKAALLASQVFRSPKVHFDPGLPVVLICDASPHGVGAVLAHPRSTVTVGWRDQLLLLPYTELDRREQKRIT